MNLYGSSDERTKKYEVYAYTIYFFFYPIKIPWIEYFQVQCSVPNVLSVQTSWLNDFMKSSGFLLIISRISRATSL